MSKSNQAPKAPAKTAPKRATITTTADGIGPCVPEGYEPVGDIVELSRGEHARVVSDDVRVWKEAL